MSISYSRLLPYGVVESAHRGAHRIFSRGS